MIKFETPEPPRGRELFHIISAVAELEHTLAPALMSLPDLPAELALRILKVDRLKLIGKIAAGGIEAESIDSDEICVLILTSVIGMIREGASPSEVRKTLSEVLSSRMAQQAMHKASSSAGAKP